MTRAALLLALLPALATAQGLDLDPDQRKAFGAALRATLLENPEIVAEALSRATDPAPQLYAEDIAADLTLIDRHADQLFSPEGARVIGITGPIALASFAAPGSPADQELAALAEAHAIRIALRDPADHPALVAALGLDMMPAHVFPDRIVQGDIPATLLQRYLPQP